MTDQPAPIAPTPASPDAPGGPAASPRAPDSPAATAGWMLAVLGLGVLILAALAQLAP